MALHAKIEVPSRGKLDMNHVEKRRPISGQGDHILGTARKYFYHVGIRETRMPTDHRMVLGELIGEEARRHQLYDKERSTWPITSAKGGTGKEVGSYFNNLKRRFKKPSHMGRTMMATWISDATWRLADQRAEIGKKLTAKKESAGC